jgi:arylsulfatase A-like enzyme
MVFDRMFCAAPACSPSRACAMTGLHTRRNGCIGLAHHGWPLRPEVPTLVDHLNRAGFETILSGINHETLPRTSRYQTDLTLTWAHWQANQAVDNAIGYLDKRTDTRPFYCNIATQHPHPITWAGFEPVPPEQVVVPPWCPDSPCVRDWLGRFQASIAYMDHHVGRLIDFLRRRGLLETTMVVFTTDHGIGVPRAKGELYDRGTEIAFMVRPPGPAGPGSRSDALLTNLDLVPTFLDVLGVPVPDGLDGVSFYPALCGTPFEGHDAIFTERNVHGNRDYKPMRSIRTRTHHYIRNMEPQLHGAIALPPFAPEVLGRTPALKVTMGDLTPAWPERSLPSALAELYDVVQDPDELHNLADDPAHAEVRDRLRNRLEAWMKETDDFAAAGRPPPPETAPQGWGDPAVWPLIPS